MKYKSILFLGVRVEKKEVEAVVVDADSFYQPIPVMKKSNTTNIQNSETVRYV